MLCGGLIVQGIVTAILLYVLFRRPSSRSAPSARALIVSGGVVLPVATLTALLAYSLPATQRLRAAEREISVDIEVVGRRWWWEVRYLDAEGTPEFRTANELYLPLGEAIRVRVTSADVIHSFWVPSLAGKIDLIPGHENAVILEPTSTGTFRGQCAEYCGTQHANMALDVVTVAPGEFQAWRLRQKQAATQPTGPAELMGHDVFMRAGCALCHTVRGTPASGSFGPDLTHLGSRRTIAAGALPMNRGTLAAWILSAQHIKPDNLMPSFNTLSGEELQALVLYLESLK